MMNERRKFTRVLFNRQISIKSSSGIECVAEVDNFSLKGGFVRVQDEGLLALDEKIRFVLVLSKQEDIVIEGDARVVWTDGKNGYGLSCDTMGVEYFSHLKRLIELNLEDTRLIHHDIAQLVGAA